MPDGAIPVPPPSLQLGPEFLHPDFGDPETLRNSRDWRQKSLETRGARITGGGCGMGGCDLDFELKGGKYLGFEAPLMDYKPLVLGADPEIRIAVSFLQLPRYHGRETTEGLR